MATQDSIISQLSPALRELVLAATSGNHAFGQTENDKEEVSGWITKATSVDLSNEVYFRVSSEIEPVSGILSHYSCRI